VSHLNASTKQKLIELNAQTEGLLSPYAALSADAVREKAPVKKDDDFIRSPYAVDIDRILHCPFYTRGNDKTQVFSFFQNDDITRRSFHVQLVSRIARIIGRALRLNLDLIEAIAVGHDIGHTPFGHRGEEFLSKLSWENAGRLFNHNVHSVRALRISGLNLTVQTLDGILCHCGERAFGKYEPAKLRTFAELDATIEGCYTERDRIHSLRPSTLEGCIVRISDMVAYMYKDRQDANRVGLKNTYDKDEILGENISNFITNVVDDIICHSIDKPYISMSDDMFAAIERARKENNEKIYGSKEVEGAYGAISDMMKILYNRFCDDFKNNNYDSLLYKHHLNNNVIGNYYRDKNAASRAIPKDKHTANDVVVDFIASMTDDYFVECFKFLYPKSELNEQIKYVGYFDGLR